MYRRINNEKIQVGSKYNNYCLSVTADDSTMIGTISFKH
jgi:hypothetical protein